MYKIQLIGLLVAVLLAQDASNSYFLTPPLPPTAYFGQYYTVQLRVVGMNNPIFSFSNVPACFSTNENGTIKGYPDEIGSFAIKVSFQSIVDSGSRDIVIRVAPAVNGVNQRNT
jgi:hypothetical protein